MTSLDPTVRPDRGEANRPPSSGFVVADIQVALEQYRSVFAARARLTEEEYFAVQPALDLIEQRLSELLDATPEHRAAASAVISEIRDYAERDHDRWQWPTPDALSERTRQVIDATTDPPATFDDLARLHQLTWTAYRDTDHDIRDHIFQTITAQRDHLERFLVTQPTLPARTRSELKRRFHREATTPDAILPHRFTEFGDWHHGIDPFDPAPLTLPADVALRDSAQPNTRYLVHAGQAVRIHLRDGTFTVAVGRHLMHHPTTASFADATRIALDTIATWRAAGASIHHRRDGIFLHDNNEPPRSLDHPPPDLRTAHQLYLRAAQHLRADPAPERCGLDPHALLETISHATTTTDMLAGLTDIAHTLDQRADAITATPRPSTTSATDRGIGLDQLTDDDIEGLRRIATAITAPPRTPRPGDHIVTFRNAINNRNEQTRIEPDEQSARHAARDHRPYNNTRVHIDKVLSVHYDGTRTERIHTTPTRTPTQPATRRLTWPTMRTPPDRKPRP